MSYLVANLNYLLKKNKTNPNDLEEKHPAIKQSTLFRILNGITKDPRRSTLEPIAQWAGMSVNELFDIDLEAKESISTQNQTLGDVAQIQPQSVPQQTNITDLSIRHDGLPASKQTPVISWVAAGDFTEVLSADLSRVIEWIPYNPRAGQYGFALIVEGVSMEPKFMPDDRIYVNPTFQINELHTGDLVIMACDGDEKGTFKELVVEDGNYYLRPLNPNWQPRLMPVDHNCRLVGKVVGKFVNFE